jgi:integrase
MRDSANPMPRNDNRVEMTERWLNSKQVEPLDGERREFVDRKAQGLVLRVSRRGGEILKAWTVRYRPKGAAQRRFAIGEYGPAPLLTLEAARQRARKIVTAARDGVDLPAKEAEDRSAKQAEKRQKTAPQTLTELLDLYICDYCRANQRRWQLTERIVENHVRPAPIGSKPLLQVRRADLIELLDHLQNRKGFAAQVNRVRSLLLAAFNWAVEREKIEVNPAAGIKRRKGIEVRRTRVLTDDELRAIWTAAAGLSDPSRSLVKAWILVGQRRDEVRCLPWSEIDEGNRVWLLPATRNKSKRDHLIPLAPAIATILGDLPQLGALVFTVSGNKPYAGQKRLKEILDRESGVRNWTFHDFRRTASSGMARLGVPQDIIDRVLNHAKPTLAGTYNLYEYMDEKRLALETWAEHIAFVVGEGRKPYIKYPERAARLWAGDGGLLPPTDKAAAEVIDIAQRRIVG